MADQRNEQKRIHGNSPPEVLLGKVVLKLCSKFKDTSDWLLLHSEPGQW